PPKTVPTTRNASTRTPPKATPTPTRSRSAGSNTSKANTQAAAPPKAGSGSEGGKGADVVSLQTDGIAFPDQGYINNIVRQLYHTWKPGEIPGTRISEVRFTIRRDGSVSDIQVVKASGDRLYDIEAQGAVEAVGRAGRF